MNTCIRFVSVLFWKRDHMWKHYLPVNKSRGRKGRQCVSWHRLIYDLEEALQKKNKTENMASGKTKQDVSHATWTRTEV